MRTGFTTGKVIGWDAADNSYQVMGRTPFFPEQRAGLPVGNNNAVDLGCDLPICTNEAVHTRVQAAAKGWESKIFSAAGR